uniref:Col_cuticle_N domain-containing protein n=1 Tax=Rhabditophanes sp. KR3021 TaxID=114890 RepID=A0AC35TT35_9BILA
MAKLDEDIIKVEKLRKITFLVVLFASSSVLLSIIAVPMCYNYVQQMESLMQVDIHFCKTKSNSIFREIVRTQVLSETSGRKKREATAQFDSQPACCGCSVGVTGEQGPPGRPGMPGFSYGIAMQSDNLTEIGKAEQGPFISLCFDCPVGQPGPAGNPGPKGVSGRTGVTGRDGEAGIDGDNGVRGLPGIPGARGIDGLPGKDGRDGIQKVNFDGPIGPIGKRGNEGACGLPGAVGRNGLPGSRGIDGVNGIKGNPGPNGKQGIDGAQGIMGAPGSNFGGCSHCPVPRTAPGY